MKLHRQICYKTVSAIGLLMFIVGAWLARGLFPFDLNQLGDGALFNWQIKALMRDFGAVLALSALIIKGGRVLRTEGLSFRSSVLPAVGYIIVCIFMVLNAVAYVQTDKILVSYDFSDMIASMEALLGRSDLTERKRMMLQVKLAESYYLQDGRLVEIDTKGGQKSVYRPTKENIRFKRQNDFTRQHIGWIKSRARNFVFVWVGVLVLATLAGLGFPAGRQNRNGADPPAQSKRTRVVPDSHPDEKDRQ